MQRTRPIAIPASSQKPTSSTTELLRYFPAGKPSYKGPSCMNRLRQEILDLQAEKRSEKNKDENGENRIDTTPFTRSQLEKIKDNVETEAEGSLSIYRR